MDLEAEAKPYMHLQGEYKGAEADYDHRYLGGDHPPYQKCWRAPTQRPSLDKSVDGFHVRAPVGKDPARKGWVPHGVLSLVQNSRYARVN